MWSSRTLDSARLRVEHLDATGQAVLDAYDSGDLVSPGEWRRVADRRPAPAATRIVRVTLESAHLGEAEAEIWIDAVELRSLRTPALVIGDVTVEEGDTAATEAVFHASLSCAYFETVNVGYATLDGLARAVEDYLAADGELTFESGETVRTLSVAVVPDEVHERHEDFSVVLADAAPEQVALADGHAVGLILNDDFCPRSSGFWGAHRELWPTDHLELGGVEYAAAELLVILGADSEDATRSLARQLVAAKLNLLVGSDRDILPTVAAADTFLAEHAPGSDPRGELREEALALKDELDRYNNRECQEVPVVP